jgi:hypothetical protein
LTQQAFDFYKQLSDDLKHLLIEVLIEYIVGFVILIVIDELMLFP